MAAVCRAIRSRHGSRSQVNDCFVQLESLIAFVY
jgi:hypothetical protein